MSLRIYTGARGSQFVAPDHKGFGDMLADASVAADAPINSCNREKRAESLLRQIGKMSQAQLWDCSRHCTADCNGNCNPANPPGLSTHELRNDGAAYNWLPRGFRLRHWMQGIDVSRERVGAFIAEMAKRGHIVTQTYPGSPSEAQHVNFRREPRVNLWKVRPLKPGMRGGRAREVVALLRKIQEPGRRFPYLTGTSRLGSVLHYSEGRVDAVKRFQKDHHLTPDGVVGIRTITLMRGTARRPPSRLDADGVAFVIREEGEILHLYNDVNGFATFGIGHLVARQKWETLPPEVKRKYGTRDAKLPRAEALVFSRQLFDEDARRFERAVMKVPERWRNTPNRFAALFSVAFNFGEEVLTPGPPLTVLGKALDGKSVADVKSAWRELRDRNQPELKGRRDRELALFLGRP